MKLGKYHILHEKTLATIQRPKLLPEMIVCATELDAQPLRMQLVDQHHITVVTASNGARGVAGCRPPVKITVMPGVDINMPTGEGRFFDLLVARQRVWGDLALILVL